MKIKSSILRKLQFFMTLFGILMGFVFPVYANFFVTFKEGMFVYFTVGCIVAGITVGVVSYLFVKIILLKPLMKVSEVANNVQEKKISEHIDIQSKDSVGDIVNGLNVAVDSLREFVQQILIISGIIEDTLSQTDVRAKNSSPFYKIEKSIDIVTDVSDCMKKLSEKIIRVVDKGMHSATDSQNKLKDTTNNINGLSELMSSLVEKSGEAQHIVTLIDEIAQQTNMLSMNASIEAARAGEYGKSFAVVAGEVRELAKNVSESSHEIHNTINYIQNDIKSAIVFVEEINKNIDDNNFCGTEIRDQLDEIVNITDYNVKANDDLATSVQKLNNSFNEIRKAFELLSDNSKKIKELVFTYEC